MKVDLAPVAEASYGRNIQLSNPGPTIQLPRGLKVGVLFAHLHGRPKRDRPARGAAPGAAVTTASARV